MISIIDKKKISEEEFIQKLNSRNQLEIEEVTKSVKEIIDNVKQNGDKSILNYSKKFDNVEMKFEGLRVSDEEISEAFKKVDKKLIEILNKAKKNIYDFHKKQLNNSWMTNNQDGKILGQILRPLGKVGIYSPGGIAAYPSSVLMNCIPAKVAGVKKVIMTTPPKNDGIDPAILVAAKIAEVDEIYKIGGAQAVAALAFGTDTIEKVDKIVGPGNIYVNTAKRMVFGYCDIDMFAGPSEILIVADKTANPKYIAADLISQAEHDPLASSILISDSEKIVNEVKEQLKIRIEKESRKEIIEKSLKDYGALIIVDNINEAISISNLIAPEHLELCIEDPFSKLNLVENAGAIFVGNYSPEPLGDYFAGPNHVLPTSGTARFFSPLNVDDFIKKSSLIYYTKDALETVKDDISYFARKEGLEAHGNAIDVRFEK